MKAKARKSTLVTASAVKGQKKKAPEPKMKLMMMKAKARTSTLVTASADKGQKKTAPEPKAGGRMKLGDFYAFQQCQLKMEARCLMNREFELKDAAALEIWPLVEKLATRNQGKNEKWVPYHTVLGVHELFVVKEIHHANISCWTPYIRFLTMFVFRSHCSRDLFTKVQLPYLKQASFWKDPVASFDLKTPLHRDTLKYRKAGNVLQTSCFLIIPERLVADDTENIVMNLMVRTQRLIELAGRLWPLVSDRKAPSDSEALFHRISAMISETRGMGETWVKMLMVVIDIAFPDLCLLQKRCEVGTGAMGGMRQILEDEGLIEPIVDKEDQIHPIRVVINLKGGIAELRKTDPSVQQVTKNIQLLQVVSADRRFAPGLASLDRANAIVEKLAELARGGMQMDKLLQKKKELFKDATLKVPKLGLDAKRARYLAALAAGQKTDEEKAQDKKAVKALSKLCEIVNKSDSPSCESFWALSAQVEAHGRKVFRDLTLVARQMETKKRCLSAVTLQVQLCEWRQFKNYQQRMAKGAESQEPRRAGKGAAPEAKVPKKVKVAAAPAKRGRSGETAEPLARPAKRSRR